MTRESRIRQWLGSLFRYVPCQDCDKVQLVCLKTDCVNNEIYMGDFICGRRRVIIDRDGKCAEYQKRNTEEK